MPLADLIAKSPYPAMTWVFVVLLVILSMYFARVHAHRAILSLSRALYRTLRLGAASTLRAEHRLLLRNREVLLAAGREAKERIIEREFERIDGSVRRDISECPSLNRRLTEEVTRIEEDHQKSTEVPPAPPGWVPAVNAVAEIPSKGDPMVANILEGIHDSLVKAQEQATQDYRKSVQVRHDHLKSMMPHWRNVAQLLGQVDHKVTDLLQRTQIIDRHIDEYENIMRGSDRAERMLSSSSLVQFFIAAFVLAIAAGGAMINFHLIARPMAEMVGGNNLIGAWKIADIAALVIILVEISMGLFLMESLRFTRLFPVIGALADKWRVIMIWVTLGFLTGLASIEAGLAFMREILLQDELLLSASLRGETDAVLGNDFVWITTAAQMGMGFILPFALTFVAIPLETFVHSLRTVMGVTTGFFLRGLAMTLRLFGLGFRYLGEAMVNIYDIVIFLPLWLEDRVKTHLGNGRRPAQGPSFRET
ncbi:MAG: hypothetical protein OEM59_15095 [Rhodospirillales bacterium]|nr:hypothetical protein [Rhodospirillales bacterium]